MLQSQFATLILCSKYQYESLISYSLSAHSDIFSAVSTPPPSRSNYPITFNLAISLKFVQKHSRPWFQTSELSYRTWFSAFQKHDWLRLGLSWIDLLNVLLCVLPPMLLQHNKTKRRRLNTAFTGTKHSFEVE